MEASAGLLFVAAVLAAALPTKGLECYSCVASADTDACVVDPERANWLLTCEENVEYCVNTRVETNEELTYLMRGCGTADLPDTMLNKTVTVGNVKTHYTACDFDRCNKGDTVIGIECYSCSSDDVNCIEEPEKIEKSQMGCVGNVKYCLITRVESDGQFVSLLRSCGIPNLSETLLNTTVTTGAVKTHHTACDYDYCNKGDGVIYRQCYSCSATEETDACVLAPADEWITPCPTDVDYCINTRVETDGVFTSLTRGCGTPNLPDSMLNRTETVDNTKTHHTACDFDKCNNGDGFIGIECYSCSSDDENCIEEPEKIENSQMGCVGNVKYCLITRVESDGEFVSLLRSCGIPNLSETLINTTVIVGTTKTHHTACDFDTCNKGDGVVNTVGLKCYSCTTTDGQGDCEDRPEDVETGQKICTTKYCGIIRTTTISETGSTYTLERNCMDDKYALVFNSAVFSQEGDLWQRMDVTACVSDLCNDDYGWMYVCGDGTRAGPAALALLGAAALALLSGRAGN